MMLRTIASGRLAVASTALVRESRRTVITSSSKDSMYIMSLKSLSSTTTSMTTLYSSRYQSTASSAVMEEKPTEPSPSAAATTATDNEGSKLFVPTADRKYEYFTNVEFTKEGVAIIRFDCPNKVNTISFALSDEARQMWKGEIENNSDVKAVVFSSAKPDMFIAGADIFDIKRIENKDDLVGLIEEGVNFFKHMREKEVPLVCAINGPALGGGLEWAMWCDYRVCSDSPKTKVRLVSLSI
jgi:hypothetical protein